MRRTARLPGLRDDCATLWLPTQIFDFDINPSSAGPIKHIDGSIQMPLSPDK